MLPQYCAIHLGASESCRTMYPIADTYAFDRELFGRIGRWHGRGAEMVLHVNTSTRVSHATSSQSDFTDRQ